MLSLAFIPQRENSNTSFAGEKIDNPNKLVNKVTNTKINNFGYELNTVTMSDTQVKFAIYPYGITHTNNGITHQNLCSSRIIGIRHEEVSVLPPTMDPRIGTNNKSDFSIINGIVLVPPMLNYPAVKEIITATALNNTGKNRTPRRIIRTGVGGTTPVQSRIRGTYTPYPSGIIGTSTPYFSGISGTSATPPCGMSDTSAATPSGGL